MDEFRSSFATPQQNSPTEKSWAAERFEFAELQTAVIQKVVDEHIRTLVLNHRRLVVNDEYGFQDLRAWQHHMKDFFERAILPAIYKESRLRDLSIVCNSAPREQMLEDAIYVIHDSVEIEECINETKKESAPTNPLDYELYCEVQVKEAGWKARRTQTTGDQGADIIASKGGKTLVIQCKRYSRPVGNKAVQEIFAAKTHYTADLAAVVSNKSYTPAAKRLAKSTGIALLHDDELATFLEGV